MAKVTIDNLDDVVMDILKDYEDDVNHNLDVITKKVGQAGVKALNDQAGKTFKGKKYKKSWASTAQKGRLYSIVTLYSKMPGLPHLLEHGHAKVGGGRVKGRVHIEPVEKKLISQYEKEVTAKL